MATELILWRRLLLAGALLLALAAPAAARSIVDQAGRTVELPPRIERVVPLGGALRYLTYLQCLDKVVGMERAERKWSSPGRLYGLATAALAQRLPVVGEGGPDKLPDFEQLLALQPDLLLVMGAADSYVARLLEKTGLPVVVLSYGEPGVLDLDAARKALTLLGEILDRRERAADLIGALDGWLGELKRRSAALPERRSAYVGGIGYKGVHGITSTDAVYAPLTWAGGLNVAAATRTMGHQFIDPEQLLGWQPEVIFLDAGGLELVAQDDHKNPGFYRHLRAAANGEVYLVFPYNYYHTNLEIALADAFYIGKCLYPAAFADLDVAARADEIFTRFVGIAAYAQLRKEYGAFGRVVFTPEGVKID